ncbi:MAG: TraR/DksA family transcriptional regulator [Planctomycetota bacterium]|jgi:RNA polymerase-binding transcription factor DksA
MDKKSKKLTQKQLEHYQGLLIDKMKEILGDVSSLEETLTPDSGDVSSMPVHLADMGTDSYEQDFNLNLVAEERKTLVEIQQALARIQNETFGLCEGLDTPIEPNRLEAIPWTRYSLEYAKMIESGEAMRVDNFRKRPIDIQREAEEQEDYDTDDTPSVDDIADEEDYDAEDEDVEKQRNSA